MRPALPDAVSRAGAALRHRPFLLLDFRPSIRTGNRCISHGRELPSHRLQTPRKPPGRDTSPALPTKSQQGAHRRFTGAFLLFHTWVLHLPSCILHQSVIPSVGTSGLITSSRSRRASSNTMAFALREIIGSLSARQTAALTSFKR